MTWACIRPCSVDSTALPSPRQERPIDLHTGDYDNDIYIGKIQNNSQRDTHVRCGRHVHMRVPQHSLFREQDTQGEQTLKLNVQD